MQGLNFNPALTAVRLLECWRNGELLTSLPPELKPGTLAQGYDAQDALFKAAGGRRNGWKLGVGSRAAMRAANLERPLVGQLETARCYPSGTTLLLPASTPVTVECEIAFVMGRDLPPFVGREVQPGDIEATCVTFEVVRSRFVDRKAVGWPSFVADNVGFEALIVGHVLCEGANSQALAELAESAVVLVNGEPMASGLKGEAATDPLASLTALYAHAAERGTFLRQGDIVSTGAMCAPFDLQGTGYHLSVEYAGKVLEFFI
ncbi:2-keto-4-pentenoate hydratase [Ectopseudomonas khazarica]|uniref:2-keto-4-pentenoate hydratase n=1 Tax=Ectopseudomonas khazarica TaxID=2502979 RepID=UPI00106E781D|nr:fumarylacetoacetate hydrolase family protein [Pseudomonas khazarica]